MRFKHVSAIPCLIIFLLVLTGCESLDLGPGPTVLMGPKPPPRKQQEAVVPKQRLTAPDEEATLGPTPLSAAQTVKDETLGGSRAAKTTQMIFTGKVAKVDTASRTISLNTSGKQLAFDLVNPVLRGYQNTNDIKVGDTVSLAYIPDGIAIAKGETFPDDLKAQTTADDLSPPKNNNKKSRQNANNRGAPVRVKYKVNRMSFADVDNNKDGKVSPVELGAVLPSVTMEDFKRYDRNDDGLLDANEYKSVPKR